MILVMRQFPTFLTSRFVLDDPGLDGPVRFPDFRPSGPFNSINGSESRFRA